MEATITIDGHTLTVGQSMSVRVTITAFLMELNDKEFAESLGQIGIHYHARFLAGKHSAFTFNILETIEASSNVSVSEAKIADMMANPERLKSAPPLIFVEDGKSDDGRPMVWLIDGHHRVRALYGLGYTQCAAFVIEEKNAARYRLHFNGERTAPWMAWVG